MKRSQIIKILLKPLPFEKILERDESRFNQLENNVNRLGGHLSLKSEFELIKQVIPNKNNESNMIPKVSLKVKLKQAKQVSQAVNQTKKLVTEKGG